MTDPTKYDPDTGAPLPASRQPAPARTMTGDPMLEVGARDPVTGEPLTDMVRRDPITGEPIKVGEPITVDPADVLAGSPRSFRVGETVTGEPLTVAPHTHPDHPAFHRTDNDTGDTVFDPAVSQADLRSLAARPVVMNTSADLLPGETEAQRQARLNVVQPDETDAQREARLNLDPSLRGTPVQRNPAGPLPTKTL